MKHIYMLLIMGLFVFSGCSATDKFYGKAKKVWIGGEWVYEHQPLDSKTLEAADKAAKKYDKVRTIIREP